MDVKRLISILTETKDNIAKEYNENEKKKNQLIIDQAKLQGSFATTEQLIETITEIVNKAEVK